MLIFLADLGHNQATLSSDVYPLGVANLAAYVQEYLECDESPVIRLFREPEDLEAALDRAAPDVLGLSSYAWNHQLSLAFARLAKARHAGVLTLMGGPNFPLTPAEQEAFMRGMPEVDVAVRGPTYEGERAFLNLVQRFVDVAGSRQALFDEPIPGNAWIDPSTERFIAAGHVERICDLDEIPSPYLNGWFEPFFDTGYFPMMQISRGCPFGCTFCNSSVPSNNKIFRHSVENVKKDLLYAASRVRPEIPLCLADDNFGMFPWDEEVADYLHDLQDRFDWPQYVRTTTGKNKHERIIRVMRKARKALPMTAAVQSLNPVVLENIDRSNIKLDAYAKIHAEVQAEGMQSYGELILCLPGETKASFMSAMRELLQIGVQRISAHQLMLQHGAPLSDPESRRRWGFQTRFRVVARNAGRYACEPVVETEEIVVTTPTFSFDDYLDVRVFHLLLTIFYYEGNFEEAFAFARQRGVVAFDLIVKMQSLLSRAPQRFRALVDDFLCESRKELFLTNEDCTAWARANLDALVDGSLGGNLLSRYSMLGRFYLTEEALAFLETAIEAAVDEPLRADASSPLRTTMDYLHTVLLRVPFRESMECSPRWTADYDVETWRADGYSSELASYAFVPPRVFTTMVAPDRRTSISGRIATFGEHPAGLGKFTRTVFARDLRRTLIPTG